MKLPPLRVCCLLWMGIFPCLGAPGFQYSLQASTDLVTWTTVTNVTADSLGHFQFSTGTSNYPVRFFRLSWP